MRFTISANVRNRLTSITAVAAAVAYANPILSAAHSLSEVTRMTSDPLTRALDATTSEPLILWLFNTARYVRDSPFATEEQRQSVSDDSNYVGAVLLGLITEN